MQNKETTLYSRILVLIASIIFLLMGMLIIIPLIALGKLSIHDIIPESELSIAERTDFFAKSYDVSKLSDAKEENKQIKYGYELITNTFLYLGPENGNPEMVFSGNNLACKNCHLQSGTKAFAAPYVGVTKVFPQFSARGGKTSTIEDRINGCMERSMNGKKLPKEGKEMQAMVAYMTWLSKDVPDEYKVKGNGFVKIDLPDRAVDLAHGSQIYQKHCVSCHLDNGEGVKAAEAGYIYPPLSGDDTYNHGAGMHRVITSAEFIKGNMPFGASAEKPILTDEEAFDVAGYINTFNRPQKIGVEKDYPDKTLKPMSSAYGPYADTFSLEQHKFGPYKPIAAFYLKEYDIKKTK